MESEIKSGTLVDYALRPDPAIVAVNDALHNSQSDAGSFVIFCPVQPLENAE
jgi:hypothetical protein